MKLKLLAAAAMATVALSGVARADLIISENLNGTITQGIDTIGLFGTAGADLTGQAVNVFFSYDIDTLNADASYANNTGHEQYSDSVADSSVTETVTINGQTASQTNSAAGSQAQVLGCDSGWCGQSELETYALASGSSLIASYLFGSYEFPLGSLANQSAIDAYVAALTDYSVNSAVASNGFVTIQSGVMADNLSFNVSSTPEPATWISFGLGLLGAALTKYRRR